MFKCSDKGGYEAIQCQGSSCFCADSDGQHITDFTAVHIVEHGTLDCKCAREADDYSKSGRIGKAFRCNNKGSYDAIQCQGSSCFCADNDGQHITDFTAVHIVNHETLDCKCAREADDYRKSQRIGKMFECNDKGGYKAIQCQGSSCFCADSDGQHISDFAAVHIVNHETLDCKCARARDEYRKTGRLGNTHSCDHKGGYEVVQCQGTNCFCADVDGQPITDFLAVHITEVGTLGCRCARDQHNYAKTGMVGKTFRCDSKGAYEKLQCSGAQCFCADSHGQRIPGSPSVPVTESQDLDCSTGAS